MSKVTEGRTELGRQINKQNTLSDDSFTRQSNTRYGTIKLVPSISSGDPEYKVIVEFTDKDGRTSLSGLLALDANTYTLAGDLEPQDLIGEKCYVKFYGPSSNTGKVHITGDFSTKDPESVTKVIQVPCKGTSWCIPGGSFG